MSVSALANHVIQNISITGSLHFWIELLASVDDEPLRKELRLQLVNAVAAKLKDAYSEVVGV